MKIGFYDSDYKGGRIPMITKLKEETIPFNKIDNNNLKSVKELDLLIINSLGITYFPEKFLEDYYKDMREIIELNPDTKFLMMIPGEDWIRGINEKLGIHENIDYVIGTDVSKLTELVKVK